MLKNYDEIIGKQLKKVRESKGYTLNDVAGNVNSKISTISNYEQGIRSIPVPKLKDVLDFMNYDFFKFMSEVFELCEKEDQ